MTNPTPQTPSPLGDQLLAQQRAPAPSPKLDAYRKDVAAMIELNERRLRRERTGVMALWIFLVATSTIFMISAATHIKDTAGPYFATLAVFWFLYGAVELLKHFINRARVDVLKEVKQLELRVAELTDRLDKR